MIIARSLVVAVLLTSVCAGPEALAQAQAAKETEDAARALVPLLQGLKKRLDSGWRLQQGSLPNSPFTGRQSTIVALKLGKSSVEVPPDVEKAMAQLLAWKIGKTPAGAPEPILFDHWLVQLKVKSAIVRDPTSTVMECDTACVVNTYTEPGESFGKSPREREELRDQVLLEALIGAVDELK